MGPSVPLDAEAVSRAGGGAPQSLRRKRSVDAVRVADSGSSTPAEGSQTLVSTPVRRRPDDPARPPVSPALAQCDAPSSDSPNPPCDSPNPPCDSPITSAGEDAPQTLAVDASLGRIRRKYGLDAPTDSEADAIYATGRVLLGTRLQCAVHAGDTVDDEHPLLPALLGLLEVAVQHGWREAQADGGPWDVIAAAADRTGARREARAVVANVRAFTTLRRPHERLRLWVRLALMAKTLAGDLTDVVANETAAVARGYAPGAFVRSDVFQPFLALVAALDDVHFNLYVAEASVPRGRICAHGVFARGRVDFARLSPPVGFVPDAANADDESGSVGDARESDARPDGIGERMRAALLAMTSQRAYYREEWRRASASAGRMLEEHDSLHATIADLRRRLAEQRALLDAHEQTNAALQAQLASAAALAEGPPGDTRLFSRMRRDNRELEADLAYERAAGERLRDALAAEEKRARDAERMLADARATAAEQISVLSEHLRAAALGPASRADRPAP